MWSFADENTEWVFVHHEILSTYKIKLCKELTFGSKIYRLEKVSMFVGLSAKFSFVYPKLESLYPPTHGYMSRT